MSSKLWSIDEVSDYLQISKNTLYQWRTKNYGPPAHPMGKYIRYRPEDVDTWIEQQGGV